MKKSTITILATLMGISFACLLVMQVHYIQEVMDLRRQHFDETVNRCLNQVVKQIELDEAARYLEQGVKPTGSNARISLDTTTSRQPQMIHQIDSSLTYTPKGTFNDKYYTKINKPSIGSNPNKLKDVINKHHLHLRELVAEVTYSMLFTASDRPIKERIDFQRLDQILKSEFSAVGIDLHYHFNVRTANGVLLYQCPDYDTTGENTAFTQTIFNDEPARNVAILNVHFPELEKYSNQSIRFIMPSLIFTLILLVTFIVTLVLVFRQKKLAEVKNDFINNMTHEFKTPLSSISLAAQMLGDESVTKTPKMMNRLTNTINDETKRLRFQVEKVLQLSMYENQRANLNLRETDMNELIAGVIHTFALKVEKNGGKIISDLKASNPTVYVDEMHITNVIFNLMDNAVKYKRDDTQLELKLSTWNESHHVYISIQDNGIGIKKDDLKKIFEKFYRVHTGNRHDVKGFGLGLAYVKKIIREHKGSITAESELGIGTKFIIRLPMADK